MAMPEYTDGVLELLRIEEDCSQDFPVEKVRSTGMHIWYRELSVFDTTRAKLSADSDRFCNGRKCGWRSQYKVSSDRTGTGGFITKVC